MLHSLYYMTYSFILCAYKRSVTLLLQISHDIVSFSVSKDLWRISLRMIILCFDSYIESRLAAVALHCHVAISRGTYRGGRTDQGNGTELAPCRRTTLMNMAEWLSILARDRIISDYVAETVLERYGTSVTTYSTVLFLQDTLRFEFNPDCYEMIFVVTFDSEDLGISIPAVSIFMLDTKSQHGF
jgi:hypothetical protein